MTSSATCAMLGMAVAAWPSVAAAAGDRDVGAAMASLAREIADIRQSCTDPVRVDAAKVALADKVGSVHVVLTSPVCLGQWGTYDYLLVRDLDGRWRSILGGPGPIRFSRRPGSRAARIDVSAMMGCELSLTWNGTTYVERGSPECEGGSKGTEWRILERVMRASEGSASAEDRSPIALLGEVVTKVDRGELPDWTDPRFPLAMRPYLTPGLIAAVLYGKRTAKEKGIDLYDGEFLTGRQTVHRARLIRADVTGMDADRAVITAVIGTNEGHQAPIKGSPYTYMFRLVDGGWKIDDFRIDPRFRSVKDTFLHPENGDPVAH